MPATWQQPLALVVVALAAGWLILRAWRQRRASATTGGCGSGGDSGCGCSALKKTLRTGSPARRPAR
ncbi:MAG: hypothetical protein NTU80_10740 [Verrucomicrobia bacterium]|nr:hypothetical protein [Verrucomicrobiota bacterium]